MKRELVYIPEKHFSFEVMGTVNWQEECLYAGEPLSLLCLCQALSVPVLVSGLGVTLLLWRRTGPPSTKTHVTDALLNELQINNWEDCLNLFWIIMLWFMCLLRFIILYKRKEP